MSLASVVVPHHAQERARERFGREFDSNRIRGEVRAALAEGRSGCKPPRHFRSRNKGLKRDSRRGTRYCWSPDGRRCYVLHQIRGNGTSGVPVGAKAVVVKTVYTPFMAAAA